MSAITNAAAYCAQVTLLVAVCAGMPRALRLSAPIVQHAFWRTLLGLCLALPLLQPWRAAPVPSNTDVPGSQMSWQQSSAQPARDARRPIADDAAWLIEGIIAGGIAVRLAWMALGFVRLRRLRRRATEAAPGFDDLRAAIGVDCPILWSADARHPVTFGLRRPVVLLPHSLRAVDVRAQRAVVAHELHHVKRRDWAWVVGEELVRSLFWFHPAIWWLVSRVQLARETVVDELSILVTNARRAYLDALLAFADDTGLASPAFSARRHLFHRVMLLSKEGAMSSSRVALASGVLIAALVAGAVGAVAAFPLYRDASVSQEPQMPARDPLTPEAHHRRAQEHWQKANSDATLTREAKLQVIAQGLAAEDRALAMNPDYLPALLYKSLFLKMRARLLDDAAEREALMRQAEELRDKADALRPMPPPPPPAPPQPAVVEDFAGTVDGDTPLRVGGPVKPPVKVHDVKPVYPADALAANVQGVVVMEILIDKSGAVDAARVLRSVPMLDQAALDAVRAWRFQPTLLNGVPQRVVMTVTINFTVP